MDTQLLTILTLAAIAAVGLYVFSRSQPEAAASSWHYLLDKLRATPLLFVGVVTLWLISVPNPLVQTTNTVKIGLIAWLICKESVLAYLGYWIDRLLHPTSRPGSITGVDSIARMAAEKRRAFIVCAAMLAGGLFQ